MFIRKTILTVALLLSAHNLHAADTRVGAGYSALGPTIEVFTSISDHMTVRGTYSVGKGFSGSNNIDGTTYALNGKIGGLSGMFNYHFPTGFRMGAGFLKSTGAIHGTLSGESGDQIGDETLSGPVSLSADAKFARSYSPITTIGWDMPVSHNIFLSADAGLVFNGGFDVELAQTYGSAVPSSDIQAAESEMEAQLSEIKHLPYLSIALGFQF